MRYSLLKSKLFLLLLLLNTGLGLAQTVDDFILSPEDLGTQVTQVFEDVHSRQSVTLEETISFRHHRLRFEDSPASPEFPSTVDLVYGYFEDPSDLAKAWRSLLTDSEDNPVISNPQDPHGWGDSVLLNSHDRVDILKGHAMIGVIWDHSEPNLTLAQRRALLEKVRDKFLERTESAGIRHLQPFALSLSVEMLATGVRLSGVQESEFDFGYQFELRDNLGETVRASQSTVQVNDGQIDISLTGLAPGEYQVTIWAGDAIGKESQFSHSFNIEPAV